MAPPDSAAAPNLPRALLTAPAGESIRASDPPVATGLAIDFDDFTVGDVIAAGGMGVVRSATQVSLDREVAIKQLKPGAPDSAAARIVREARITGRLDHPNVPPIHALRHDLDGQPSVVMKRIQGVSLLALLDNPDHSLGPKTDRLYFIVDTISSVCRALSSAHAQGIVHRDVKPANIMLGALGEVFLVDWGLAVDVDEWRPSGVVGTPAYMAPEMLNQAAVGPFTDVYLAGATLYHALAGRPLHAGERFIDVVQHIIDAPPLVFDESIPSPLQAVCRRATHPDPEARWPTADAFRVAMQQALRHQTSVDLANAAHRRVDVIRSPDRAERERRRAFDEARFGLAEAERQWPDNPDLFGIATAARSAMIAMELESANVAGAAALLAEAPMEHPELAARLDALQREKAVEGERNQRWARIARDSDTVVGHRARALGLASFALVSVSVMVAMFALRLDVGYPEMLGLHGVTIAAAIPVLVAVWFRIEHNRISRRLILSAVVMTAFLPMCTAVGAVLDLPIVEFLLVESLALAPGYLLTGIALDRRVIVGAPVVFAGVAFGLVVPAHAPLGVGLAHVGAMVAASAALMWLPVRSITET